MSERDACGVRHPIIDDEGLSRMLDHARTTTYEVGADLKGAAVVEVWPLALPVDTGDATCVTRMPSSVRGVVDALEAFGWTCRVLSPDDLRSTRAPVADLVYVAADVLDELPRLNDVLTSIVARDGVVAVPSALVGALIDGGWHERERLWCSPSVAEPVAIVPASDRVVVSYFTTRRLGHPSTVVPAVRPGEPDARGDVLVLLGRAPMEGAPVPPPWLRRVAARDGVAIDRHRWGIWARRQFTSQKVIVFLFDGASTDPSAIVKLPREPRFNDRIEHDYRAIEQVHGLPGHERHVPEPCFEGEHAGRRVAAVRAVDGTPFPEEIGEDRHGPLARSVIEWLGRLGASTARARPSADVGDPLLELIARVAELYPLTGRELTVLRQQVEQLVGSADTLPVVLQHGNVADWNLIVRPDGTVTFLDWEFAEPNGLPLWDLYFFLRFQDWPLVTGWRRTLYGRWRPRRDLFLRPSGAPVMRDAIARYRRYVAVPPAAVEPLFHLCWAHQCLNAATHETTDRLAVTPMFRMLRRGLAMREAGRTPAFFDVA